MEQLTEFPGKINSFFTFIGNNLTHFGTLSRGEQVAYPSIGLGLILIIVGVVLLIL